MNFSSKILEDAVNAMSALPGIGKKSALRLVLHLAQDTSGKSLKMAAALERLENGIKKCQTCCNFSDVDLCEICKSAQRLGDVVCVVESARDVMAIEDTNQFKGKYHVLGGVISPLDGVGPDDLSIAQLVERVRKEGVSELIMAISPTIEGETTIYYISKLLKEDKVNISIIARGVSFGGELEYADEFTLGRSIASRVPYHTET